MLADRERVNTAVDPGLPKQERDHAFVGPKRARQLSRFAILASFRKTHQCIAEEITCGREDGAQLDPFLGRITMEPEDQIRSGTFAGQLVLGVGEQRFKSEIYFDRDGGNECISLELRKRKRFNKMWQRKREAGGN